jgi:glycosyltransferase 2 family protein
LDIRGGDAVAYVLLVRFVLFVPVTVAGLVLMLTRYGGLSRMFGRRAARDEAETMAAAHGRAEPSVGRSD